MDASLMRCQPGSPMAENRRARGEGFYYFNRGQLAILGAAFTVTSVVIFFLGILVGQGIEERKMLKSIEPVTKIPVRPLRKGSDSSAKASTDQQMTFYDTLTQTPSRAEEKIEGKEEDQPKESSAKVEAKKTNPPAESQTTPPPKKLKKRKISTGQKRASLWSVQVRASIRERDALDLAKKLKDKGYNSYVIPTKGKGRKWYRVRVGRLATREKAVGLLETLKKKEKYTEAIIRRGG